MLTDRQRFAQLLRARHPLIVISSPEEDRVMEAVVGASVDCARQVQTWTAVRGIFSGVFDTDHQPEPGTEPPGAALRWCWQSGSSGVCIFCDISAHLGNDVVVRALRELISRCATLGGSVVLVDHQDALPEIIRHEALVFAPGRPDDQEILNLIRSTASMIRRDAPLTIELRKSEVAKAVQALRGLTRSQIRRLVAEAMADDGRFDATDVAQLADARARLLGRDGLLESIAAQTEDVAGAVNLKRWLEQRRRAIDAPAAVGVDVPRGVLLLGVPGSGKSACAKAVARWWNRPLLRLDVGSLYNQYIGETERRLRDALKQAEAMAPAVLWIDEIEKAFASAASQSTDGGLSQRMFGCLLTWMQEHTAPVFLVATANDIGALPPELLRKGRFDEIFFVDLPSVTVRRDIARIHLARRRQDPANFDLDAIAASAQGCTGADLEAAIVTAVLEASIAGRPPVTADILHALGASPPIASLMRERIAEIRAWARGRCRFADDPEAG